jgi:hypothetical protein
MPWTGSLQRRVLWLHTTIVRLRLHCILRVWTWTVGGCFTHSLMRVTPVVYVLFLGRSVAHYGTVRSFTGDDDAGTDG